MAGIGHTHSFPEEGEPRDEGLPADFADRYSLSMPLTAAGDHPSTWGHQMPIIRLCMDRPTVGYLVLGYIVPRAPDTFEGAAEELAASQAGSGIGRGGRFSGLDDALGWDVGASRAATDSAPVDRTFRAPAAAERLGQAVAAEHFDINSVFDDAEHARQVANFLADPHAPFGAASSISGSASSAVPHTTGGEEPYRPGDRSTASTPTLVSDAGETRRPAGTAAGDLSLGGALALGAGGAGSILSGALTGLETGAGLAAAIEVAPIVLGAGAVALGGYVLAHPELASYGSGVQGHPELEGQVETFAGDYSLPLPGAAVALTGSVALRRHGGPGQPDQEIASLGRYADGTLRADPNGPVLGRVGPQIELTSEGEAKLLVEARGEPTAPENKPRVPDLEVGGAIPADAKPPKEGEAPGDVSYGRPSRHRKGVRKKVFEDAKAPDGVVRDPSTNEEIDASRPWDMGHKPGYEFRKHKQSAAERKIPRKQFLDEYNHPDHYRPELPSSNRGHKSEGDADFWKEKE